MADNAAGGGDQPSKSIPKSKQGVPRQPLADAEAIARALWEAGRSSSVPPEALARQLLGGEAKASGGAWRNRMALFRVFSLAESDGEKIKLSEIGKRIVHSDPAIASKARREAVLAVTPYREILKGSLGEALPSEAGLTGTFEFTYLLGNSDAKQAAKAFITSVTDAGILRDGLVGLESSELEAAETATATPARRRQSLGERTNAQAQAQAAAPAVPPAPTPPPPGVAPAQLPIVNPPDPTIAALLDDAGGGRSRADRPRLELTLDLSRYEADDVLRILKALGLTVDDSDDA